MGFRVLDPPTLAACWMGLRIRWEVKTSLFPSFSTQNARTRPLGGGGGTRQHFQWRVRTALRAVPAQLRRFEPCVGSVDPVFSPHRPPPPPPPPSPPPPLPPLPPPLPPLPPPLPPPPRPGLWACWRLAGSGFRILCISFLS